MARPVTIFLLTILLGLGGFASGLAIGMPECVQGAITVAVILGIAGVLYLAGIATAEEDRRASPETRIDSFDPER